MSDHDQFRLWICSGIALVCGCLLHKRFTAKQLKRVQSQLTHEQGKRAADRAGRIRAEQQLQKLHLELAALQVHHNAWSDSDSTCLEGLEQFSHCWILYVFHKNTDLGKLMAARAGTSSSYSSAHGPGGVKSHIKVPRLNGAKLGVLATRSPHRPVPVGLSTAQVLRVDPVAGLLELGGVDIVDGSPVLDVKPYVPFSDALHHATTPSWVQAEADEEPLAVTGVDIGPAAAAELSAAWQQVKQQSIYNSAELFMTLVHEGAAALL
eukprot:gene11977-12120_t